MEDFNFLNVLFVCLIFFNRHFFHKSCVDQWLIEHRTCPMCKLNILKALGYGVSIEFVLNIKDTGHYW